MPYNERRSEIREFIISWNDQFPLDFWYRSRYNIKFNSEEHRKTNLIDVLIEFEEMLIAKEYTIKRMRLESDIDFREKTGKWLSTRTRQPSQSEIESAFENMDLSKFND